MSDPTETNRAYAERNRLVRFLAAVFPSGIRCTEIPGWDPEWHNCVYVDTPCGQLSWHYHDREAGLFAGLPEYTQPWDGHTTEEKYRRLEELGWYLENGPGALGAALVGMRTL